jgi:hypothetical protein
MSTPASQNKEGTKITSGKKSAEDLKTEGPLSEKDEVKKAEDRMKKNAKSPDKHA